MSMHRHHSHHHHSHSSRHSAHRSEERSGSGGRSTRSGTSRRHSSYRPSISLGRVVRRLMRHPLIPLSVIVGAVLVFAFLAEQRRVDASVKPQLLPIGQGFENTRLAFRALRLMDANQLDEAAVLLQDLALPPMRLSALIGNVRMGADEARDSLNAVIDDWLLAQSTTSDTVAFPSKNTPSLVLDFVVEVARYRQTNPFISLSPAKDEDVAILFKRAGIEKQLRSFDRQKGERFTTQQKPPDSGYQPPVELP